MDTLRICVTSMWIRLSTRTRRISVPDRVIVLGLVSEKMSERVVFPRWALGRGGQTVEKGRPGWPLDNDQPWQTEKDLSWLLFCFVEHGLCFLVLKGITPALHVDLCSEFTVQLHFQCGIPVHTYHRSKEGWRRFTVWRPGIPYGTVRTLYYVNVFSEFTEQLNV